MQPEDLQADFIEKIPPFIEIILNLMAARVSLPDKF
jgi:hypothetical protein